MLVLSCAVLFAWRLGTDAQCSTTRLCMGSYTQHSRQRSVIGVLTPVHTVTDHCLYHARNPEVQTDVGGGLGVTVNTRKMRQISLSVPIAAVPLRPRESDHDRRTRKVLPRASFLVRRS